MPPTMAPATLMAVLAVAFESGSAAATPASPAVEPVSTNPEITTPLCNSAVLWHVEICDWLAGVTGTMAALEMHAWF